MIDPQKLWVGLGNPCTKDDREFFYASTTIAVGNGARTPFWDSPCLLGRKPKDIAPLIFEALRRKNWKVREALNGSAWILSINNNTVVSGDHIREFFTLWMLINDFHLDDHLKDDIVWKHANDGFYTASTAYKAQFLGMSLSPMDRSERGLNKQPPAPCVRKPLFFSTRTNYSRPHYTRTRSPKQLITLGLACRSLAWPLDFFFLSRTHVRDDLSLAGEARLPVRSCVLTYVWFSVRLTVLTPNRPK